MAETTSAKSDDKILAAVATMPIIGLILFYAMPNASPIVKNYAKQSNALLAFNILVFIVSIILGFIPFVQCIVPLFGLLPFVAWILLLIKALNNVPDYKLPVIGDFFDKLLK